LVSRLAICVVVLGIASAHSQTLEEGRPIVLAQQTVVAVPPAPSLPSILPQLQNTASCLMGCDTRVGTCQGTCSFSNSPSVSLAPPIPGTRPDPGALAQCYINCTAQQLACKQACSIH